MTIPFHFYLQTPVAPAEVLAEFAPLGALQVDSQVCSQRTYYDTFDWRLHAAGTVLVEEKQPGQALLCWRRLDSDQLLGQQETAPPRFVAELPDSDLKSGLEPLVEMRALLPMTQMDLRTVTAAVLNQQQKTVLRLVIEKGHAVLPGTEYEPLPPRLRIEPVKGYRKPLQKALAIITRELRLEPASHLLDEGLDLSGREAGDYSGKLDVTLHPEMPVGQALRTILLRLLETMDDNLEGARQDLDSEFLHDFRVAVRRTRSAFSQIKGVLQPAVLSRFRPGFKWLGEITGPTRDLDVYLLKLPAYRDQLPTALQAELEPLQNHLGKHQRSAQRKLAKQLDSVRFRRLMQEWRAFLSQPFVPSAWTEKAVRPVGEIASRRIWKAYRKVIRDGEAITKSTPAEALHELRIDCKKLRYLMEFFQSLYPADRIRKQIKALKSLQDNLGDFHDLEVQAEALTRFGHDMQADNPKLPGEAYMAIGVLIDSLNQRQQAERHRFADRFAHFARPVNRQAYLEMFRSRRP